MATMTWPCSAAVPSARPTAGFRHQRQPCLDHEADAGAVSPAEPIFNAQLEPVRRLRVIAMDETPPVGAKQLTQVYGWHCQ
jgi:hypothetical protein